MITERLLQFLWQMQYYNHHDLRTETGESVLVNYPGQLNNNQGPDFINARIRIGEAEWVGQVELHIKSSMWGSHGHGEDINYKNVILHVVWEDDCKSNEIPVLVVGQRVPKLFLKQYGEWMRTRQPIPCSAMLKEISPLVMTAWKERLLIERLIRKSSLISGWLEENRGDWEETFWWLLARNFGARVNEDAFEELARSVPLKLLTRHRKQRFQLESILFGQGRLLEKQFLEDYPQQLQREYRHAQCKHAFVPIRQPLHFLRMRPGNFPTIRLAQLASILNNSKHLFTRVIEARKVSDVKSMLEIEASEYWNKHYLFDQLSKECKKKLGNDMINNILINTIAPALFTYGHHFKQEEFQKRSIEWLTLIDPEQNALIDCWEEFGLIPQSAADTQSLLELRIQYCDRKRCLDCSIGNSIFKKSV